MKVGEEEKEGKGKKRTKRKNRIFVGRIWIDPHT